MVDIALVGEAWGEKEEQAGKPFIGTSGWILDNMLQQVGISRSSCLVTNVFNLRPKRNDVLTLCGKKPEGIPGLPPLAKGKYVRREFEPELDRLYKEISDASPNVIIALGATAAWAFLGSMGIKGIRGATALSSPALDGKLGASRKVLPTYHPAAVARQWTIRPIVLADLDKAKRQSGSPEYLRPDRKIWIKPTLEDLATYDEQFIAPAKLLSVDIETRQEQITCIGFAPSPNSAVVIPFFSESGNSYWPDLASELRAWDYVRRWCREKPSVFQNGLYDINFLWSRYGIEVPQAAEDTMLLHHAMQPEMEKGLGFLASIYTDEASWKFMRKGMNHD